MNTHGEESALSRKRPARHLLYAVSIGVFTTIAVLTLFALASIKAETQRLRGSIVDLLPEGYRSIEIKRLPMNTAVVLAQDKGDLDKRILVYPIGNMDSNGIPQGLMLSGMTNEPFSGAAFKDLHLVTRSAKQGENPRILLLRQETGVGTYNAILVVEKSKATD